MEQCKEKEQKVKALTAPQEKVLSVDLFHPLKKSKHLKLINNEGEFTYHLSKKDMRFVLNEPTFIRKVKVYAEGNLKTLKIKYGSIYERGERVSKGEALGAYVEFNVSAMITQFDIVPFRGFFNHDEFNVTKIEIDGYLLSEAHEIEDSINSLISFKSELSSFFNAQSKYLLSREQQLESSEEELEARIEEKEGLSSQIEKSLEELAELESELNDVKTEVLKEANKKERLREAYTDLLARNKSVEDALERNDQKNKQLNKEIAQAEKGLRELIENKSLFSEVLSSFNDRANLDIRYHMNCSKIWGTLLGLISFSCFSFLAYLAFFKPEYSFEEMLTNRAPLTLFTIFIINTLYRLFKRNQDKIVSIKDHQASLHAIGIIVKESSDEIIKELDLSNEEKYDLSFRAKMDMIKNFLVNIVGENYSYKGEQVSKLSKALKRLKEGKNRMSEHTFLKENTDIFDISEARNPLEENVKELPTQ